jgi:energy-coupling factor transporter ATP-binding protein EcfA2
MRLKSVTIKSFRNILDSGTVDIEPDVTCLVGKNESGKTAFLQALYRLNPARPNVSFSVPDHYPAWLEKRDRIRGIALEDVRPVEATFAIDKHDIELIEKSLGPGVLHDGSELVVSRAYSGEQTFVLSPDAISERHFVEAIVNSIEWPHGTKTGASKARTIVDLRSHADALIAEGEESPEVSATGQAVNARLNDIVGSNSLTQRALAVLKARIPKFLYFAEYSKLPYSVPIERLLRTDPSKLDDDELTAASLLRLAAADDAYLQNPDYERRKRELENVAAALTDDVLKYWSQNSKLRVMPDIDMVTVSDGRGVRAVLNELKIRIWDDRHMLSLPFNEHSTGFQWFFSFLAAFSEYEMRSEPLVILLDEPALGLHARAQGDFLRFIDERLAQADRQVLFTTHSPFMVQPGALERVRLVEDKGIEEGTKVTSDFTSTDPDTLFPLQGALGYDLVQHLFIAPHNLVVEGTSDFTFVTVLSDHLATLGRVALDERWSIVPVGGVDLVPTFVALLGNHLDVTVLVDAKQGGHQRLGQLVGHRILSDKRIITPGLVLATDEADIEDLFEPSDYLKLYNTAFGLSVNIGDLPGSDPIVRRLARKAGVKRFDHGRPADAFLRNRDTLLPALSEETLDRFERLFEMLNATLPG